MPHNEQFVSLLIDLQSSLYGFALSLLGNREDADELLQQANLVILHKQADFEMGTNFGAWGRQVMFHEVQTFRKSRARDRVYWGDALVEQLAQAADSLTEESGPKRTALRRCLDKLTTRSRQLIEDRYSGTGVTDLAHGSNRTAAAVSQELFRIRASLANCIENKLATKEA